MEKQTVSSGLESATTPKLRQPHKPRVQTTTSKICCLYSSRKICVTVLLQFPPFVSSNLVPGFVFYASIIMSSSPSSSCAASLSSSLRAQLFNPFPNRLISSARFYQHRKPTTLSFSLFAQGLFSLSLFLLLYHIWGFFF